MGASVGTLRNTLRARIGIVMMAGLLPLSVPDLLRDATATVDTTVDGLTDTLDRTVDDATDILAPDAAVAATEAPSPAPSPAPPAPPLRETIAKAALAWAWWVAFAAALAGAVALVMGSALSRMRTHWLAMLLRGLATAALLALAVCLAFVDLAMGLDGVPFAGTWLFVNVVAWLALAGGLVAAQRIGAKAHVEPPRNIRVVALDPRPAPAEGPVKAA